MQQDHSAAVEEARMNIPAFENNAIGSLDLDILQLCLKLIVYGCCDRLLMPQRQAAQVEAGLGNCDAGDSSQHDIQDAARQQRAKNTHDSFVYSQW